MKSHLISFLRSPLGYVANLVASFLAVYCPTFDRIRWVQDVTTWACEMFCRPDDSIQSDCMFGPKVYWPNDEERDAMTRDGYIWDFEVGKWVYDVSDIKY